MKNFREGMVFGFLTDEEKEYLTDSYKSGKPIQFYNTSNGWEVVPFPLWNEAVAYRVAPEPVKPKHEPITPEKYMGRIIKYKNSYGNYCLQILYTFLFTKWRLDCIDNLTPEELAAKIDIGEIELLPE
jgi:hypothetical protein